MREAGHEQVEQFLGSLREALGRSGPQTTQVLDEVRADLEAHVERLRSEGMEEAEALQSALDELGNPYELAHRMRPQIPPFGGPVATALRYLAAAGVVVWTLFLLWAIRAWSYGASPVAMGVIVLFHLPFALLLWPRVVWRRNWLFGSGIAALGALVVIALAVAGRSSTSPVGGTLLVGEGTFPAQPAPAVEAVAEEPSRLPWFLVSLGLSGITLLLLASMQRRVQRRIAILALVVTAGGVEAAFQVEEWLFRRDVERFRSYVESVRAETGVFPTREQIAEEGPRSPSPSSSVRGSAEGWSLFWARPLSPNSSLIYSSSDGSVRAQD